MKLTWKGSFTVFILILVGFIIGLYLFGFTSPVISTFTGNPADPQATAGDFLNDIMDAILGAFTEHSTTLLPFIVGFSLLAGFTGGAYTGQSILRYIIPIIIIFAVMNIFIFPVVPTITGATTHDAGFNPLIIILTLILNVLLYLTMFEFISGSD